MEQEPEDLYERKKIPLSRLQLNTGQVPDLPKNPRFIKDNRFEALKKSIQDAPEMLELRELVAYDYNGTLVVIMGNMRYRAMKELGFKDAPVKVLPHDTPASKLREYVIKDNVPFGQNDWDTLADEFDIEELHEWGMELPNYEWDQLPDIDKEQEDPSLEKDDRITVSIPPDSKDKKDEILEAVKTAVREFDVTVKG